MKRWTFAIILLACSTTITAQEAGDEANEETQPTTSSWDVVEDTSPLTGVKTITAATLSTNEISNTIGYPDRAALVVRCGESGLAVFVGWTQVLSYDMTTLSGEPKTLAVWRIDEGELEAEYWSISTDGTAAGEFKHKRARKLLAKFAGAKRLVVRMTGRTQQDAEFDLAGIDDVVDAVSSACGIKPHR